MAGHDEGLADWSGRELLDASGAKIGKIAGLGYSRPQFGTMWLLVDTAAANMVLVPADQLRRVGERLTVPYSKTYVEGGPAVERGRRLSRTEKRRLGLHYGFDQGLPGTSCDSCGLCGTRRRGESAR
jgi:hypothetical protein